MRTNLLPLIAAAFTVAFMANARASAKDVQTLATELHWAVCEKTANEVAKKLKLDWQADKSRAVQYFDHRDLELYQQGVIWRVRSSSKKIKSTLKLRGIQENQIDWKWLSGKDFKCEWDQFGTRKKLSCSVNATPKNATELDSDQLEFLKRMGPSQVDLSSLGSYGPYTNESYSAQKTLAGLSLDLDSVTVNSRLELLEIATRVDTAQADSLMAQLTSEFQKAGLILCPTQSGLTEKILKAR